MHRVAISGIDGGEITDPRAVKHIAKALRLAAGAEILAYDGLCERHLRIERVTLESVHTQILRETPLAPAADITVAQCLIKGNRWDWFIEKMSELGVARILPVLSERSVARPDGGSGAPERWRRIALSAAAQSAGRAPEILPPATFAAALETLVPINSRFVVCFAEGARPLWDALCGENRGGAALMLGPEGDFSPGELDAALNAGFEPAHIGPKILRSETAAVVAASFALRARAHAEETGS